MQIFMMINLVASVNLVILNRSGHQGRLLKTFDNKTEPSLKFSLQDTLSRNQRNLNEGTVNGIEKKQASSHSLSDNSEPKDLEILTKKQGSVNLISFSDDSVAEDETATKYDPQVGDYLSFKGSP